MSMHSGKFDNPKNVQSVTSDKIYITLQKPQKNEAIVTPAQSMMGPQGGHVRAFNEFTQLAGQLAPKETKRHNENRGDVEESEQNGPNHQARDQELSRSQR